MQVTQELKDEICLQFTQGKFLSNLATKYKLPKVWLISFLEEKGINPSRLGKIAPEKREEIIKLYQSGLSTHKVAEQLKVSTDTVCSSLKKLGISRRVQGSNRTTYLNHNYFDEINTSNKAYFLGFIAADGCNRESRFLEIMIHKNDISVLESFIKDLESNYKIHIRKEKYAQLTIYSTDLIKGLELHGITQRKSLTLEFPKTIPEEFIPDYIRGYFDGDGYISKKSDTIEIVGTLNHMLDLAEWIYKDTDLNPSKIQQDGNVYSIFYHGQKKVAKIYNYLYKENSICLERKLLRFKQNKFT